MRKILLLICVSIVVASCESSEKKERRELAEKLKQEQKDLKKNEAENISKLKTLFASIHEDINSAGFLGAVGKLDSTNKSEISFDLSATNKKTVMLLNEEFLIKDSSAKYYLRNDNEYKRARSIMYDTYFSDYWGVKGDEESWNQVKEILTKGHDADYIFIFKLLKGNDGAAYGDILSKGFVDGVLIVYNNQTGNFDGLLPINAKNDNKVTYNKKKGDYNAADNAVRSDLTGNMSKELKKQINLYFKHQPNPSKGDVISYFK